MVQCRYYNNIEIHVTKYYIGPSTGYESLESVSLTQKSNWEQTESMFHSTMLLRCVLASTLLIGAVGQQSCVTPTGLGGSNGVNFASLNLPDPQYGFFGVSYLLHYKT